MPRFLLAFVGVLSLLHEVSSQAPRALQESTEAAPAEEPAQPEATPEEAPEQPEATPPEAPEQPEATPPEAPEEETGLSQFELDQLNRDFHFAVRSNDFVTAESLLTSGASIDDISVSGPQWSPLAEAAVNGNTAACMWLLSQGADPDVADRRGRTPLYHAAHYGMYDVVEEMLKTAKDFSAHDGDGVDMLTRCVWQNDARMVSLLLEAGMTSAFAAHAAEQADWEVAKLFGITTTTSTTGASTEAILP
mmetsp:Transcript_38979/g.72529  ORF Transcript_38979/g.72529 Transcript_38979/m.72529 type:complete len:249 (+) Transcript_38979:82-828(+)